MLHEPGGGQVEEDTGALGAEPGARIQPPNQAKHLARGMKIPITIVLLNSLDMFMVRDATVQIAW